MRQIVANAKKLKEQIGVRNFGTSVISPLIKSDASDKQNHQKNSLQPAVFKLTPSFVTRKRPLDGVREADSKKSKPAAHSNPISKPSAILEVSQELSYDYGTRDFIEEELVPHDDVPTRPMGSHAETMFIDKYAAVSPFAEKMIRNSIFWQCRSFPHFH